MFNETPMLFGPSMLETKKLSRETLFKILVCAFKNIELTDLVPMLYSKVDAIIDFNRLCEGHRVGTNISLLFNPHRLDTATNKSKSILEAFHDEKYIDGLARALLAMYENNNKLNARTLFKTALGIGVQGIQYVNEFLPYVARDIYKAYGAKRILDPCAGWGGRMIGAASIGAYYEACEPCKKTYDGLLKLGSFLKNFDTGFDYKIHNIPFEDFNTNEKYDLSFTSPPYYDTEHYDSAETQSRVRYTTFNTWIKYFYWPMIDKAFDLSTSFILNVGNRQYPLKDKLLLRYKCLQLKNKLGVAGLGRENNAESGESFLLVKERIKKIKLIV